MKCPNRFLIASLAVLATALVACSKKAPEPEATPAPEKVAELEVKPEEPQALKEKVDPVVERMQDPVYVAKLNKQLDVNTSAARDLNKAKAAYARAEAAGASEEELARLKAEVQAAAERLAVQQRKSQRLVGDQIRKQNDAK